MKIRLLCPTCSSSPSVAVASPGVELEMTDDHVYRVSCPNGHDEKVILFNPDHEILFDVGALALLDGYYGQAVMTFSAAHERYCEFHMRVLAADSRISSDAFDRAWRHLKSRSERQVGAFVMGALLIDGNAPDPIPDDLTSIRNSAAHRGGLLSRSEAIRFGEHVMQQIRNSVLLLDRDHPQGLERIRAAIEARRQDAGQNVTTRIERDMILASTFGSPKQTTLEQELVELARWRPAAYG